jgi:hypothetical protein
LDILGIVSGGQVDMEDEDDRLIPLSSNSSNEKKIITLNKDFQWFLSEEFQRLKEGFVPEGKSKYDDDKKTEEIESIKKNNIHIQQKKLLEEVQCQATIPIPLKQSTTTALSRLLLSSSTQQQPMLPLPRTLLSLPLLILPPLSLPLQIISKMDTEEKEEEAEGEADNSQEQEDLPIPINKSCDYIYDQDNLLEENTLLVTATITTANTIKSSR